MFEVNIAVILVLCLIGLVAIGVHIAIALGMTSALGIFMVTGADINAFYTARSMLAATAYEAIRAYVFAVIPSGIYLKISGKDPMKLKFDKNAKTYWIEL